MTVPFFDSMKIFTLHIMLLIFTPLCLLKGQGSGDAGLCSQGVVQSGMNIAEFKTTYGAIFDLGVGDDFQWENKKTLIYNVGVYYRKVYKLGGFFWEVNLPFRHVNGSLGQSFGLSDGAITFGKLLYEDREKKMLFQGGVRVPTSSSNVEVNGRSLPMAYQPTNGSFDGLLGFCLIDQIWQISIAYQHPFTENDNEFVHITWQDEEKAQAYSESYHILKGSDLMIRVERKFRLMESYIFAGMTPIFRMSPDRINYNDGTVRVHESTGPSLNANITWLYPITENYIMKIMGTAPIFWKSNRPDGLTRYSTLSVGLQRR